jgi:hypothetical protein
MSKLLVTGFVGLISMTFVAICSASSPGFSFIITAEEGAITKLAGIKNQYMLTIKKNNIHKPIIVILNKPYRIVEHISIDDFINWQTWKSSSHNIASRPIKASLNAYDIKSTQIMLNIRPYFDKNDNSYIIYFLWDHKNKFSSTAVIAHKITLVIDNIHLEQSNISD